MHVTFARIHWRAVSSDDPVKSFQLSPYFVFSTRKVLNIPISYYCTPERVFQSLLKFEAESQLAFCQKWVTVPIPRVRYPHPVVHYSLGCYSHGFPPQGLGGSVGRGLGGFPSQGSRVGRRLCFLGCPHWRLSQLRHVRCASSGALCHEHLIRCASEWRWTLLARRFPLAFLSIALNVPCPKTVGLCVVKVYSTYPFHFAIADLKSVEFPFSTKQVQELR